MCAYVYMCVADDDCKTKKKFEAVFIFTADCTFFFCQQEIRV